MIEKFFSTDNQGEEIQAKDVASPVPLRIREDLPIVLTTYSIITSEKTGNTQYANKYIEYKWKPMDMKALKDIKQAVASYSMHSPFVRDVIKIWASCNWVIL